MAMGVMEIGMRGILMLRKMSKFKRLVESLVELETLLHRKHES